MLPKAPQEKHGGHNSILERWHNDERHRDSLSRIEWTEQQIIQHDKLAFEDHSHVATKEERIRIRTTWVLKLNCEGVQRPRNQRLDFADAKKEVKRLNDEFVMETEKGSTHIPLQQRTKQRQDQQFERLEVKYHVDPRTGWRIL